jgi:hypothetical protein
MPARPLPIIAGTTRATWRGTNNAGQQWANVMHFRFLAGPGNPSTSDLAALDAKILRLYTGAAYTTGVPWLTNVPSNTALIDATYYILNGTSVPFIQLHTQTGAASPAANLPPEIAHCLTLRTDTRGRRYRGRIYLPAVASTAISGTSGTVTGTVTANFLTQATGMRLDLATINWEWVVASYGLGSANGLPQTWAPFATTITTLSMDGVPDVQRRRKQ